MNKRLLELADLEQENALLLSIIEAASAGPDIGPLAASVAKLITEATATDVCFVHVLDDAGQSLTLTGATPPFEEQAGKVRLPLGQGVTGWVASHASPVVIVEGKSDDARYVAIPALRGAEFTSMASVPMASEPAGLVGVLNVHTVVRREFTDRDIRLLSGIGRLVAGAMHQARMHRRLAARERAHEQFTEQVIAAQEAERGRLAGDIHDGISQRLVSLSYHLDAMGYTLRTASDLAAEQLRSAVELTELALGEARAAITGLRPPVLEDLGLPGGLASLALGVPDVKVEVSLDDVRLPEPMEIALYRIAQEGLQNLVKHARAHRALLTFTVREDVAVLRLSDDGVGFSPIHVADAPGYGLRGMTERAELLGGTLEITSRPGGGAVLTATVPLL